MPVSHPVNPEEPFYDEDESEDSSEGESSEEETSEDEGEVDEETGAEQEIEGDFECVESPLGHLESHFLHKVA